MYKNLKSAYGFKTYENFEINENKVIGFRNNNNVKKCINHFYNVGKNNFKDSLDSLEIAERVSVKYFLEPNDIVLEIGGSVGGVSEIIAKTLKNPKNLVVLEPSKESFSKLEELSKKYNFNIYNGPLVNEGENLECKKINNSEYYDCKKVEYKVSNNIALKNLEKKFNLIFNTLVIDCEGCYEPMFEKNFNNGTFNNIKKIFIEWDGKIMEDILHKNGFILVGMLPHPNLEKGNRIYVR
jgi:hypothetical protein